MSCHIQCNQCIVKVALGGFRNLSYTSNMSPCDSNFFVKLKEPFKSIWILEVISVLRTVGCSITVNNQHLANSILWLPDRRQKVLCIWLYWMNVIHYYLYVHYNFLSVYVATIIFTTLWILKHYSHIIWFMFFAVLQFHCILWKKSHNSLVVGVYVLTMA